MHDLPHIIIERFVESVRSSFPFFEEARIGSGFEEEIPFTLLRPP